MLQYVYEEGLWLGICRVFHRFSESHRELLYCWVCIKSNCIGTLKLEAEIFSQNIALRSEFITKIINVKNICGGAPIRQRESLVLYTSFNTLRLQEKMLKFLHGFANIDNGGEGWNDPSLVGHICGTEPEFVNLLRSPGIDSQPGGLVRQNYLTYRPARLHRLVELILPSDSWALETFPNSGSGGIVYLNCFLEFLEIM